MPEAPPAAASAPAALRRLGDELRTAGYDEATVLERLGVDETLLSPRDASIERRRLGDDRLSDLIRLFLLHEAVPARTVGVDAVELLESDGGTVRSSVAVQPWRGALVAHDWSEGSGAEDHVVGASRVTALLADLTVRRRVDSALDLCTGSGAQAVLASRHAGRVVGVDVNSRALRLAAWTLALSGVGNAELGLEDVRDFAARERFGLVTANPPFIVSPDRRWLYRDAAAGISEAVLERAGNVLCDGGFAHVLCQWGVRADEDWDERPRAWVADRGCDAWIMRLPTAENVLDHAAGWNAVLQASDPAEFERTVDRWLEYFSRHGIERLVLGAVVLRRRSGPNWTRADEASAWPAGHVGEEVERLFAGQTLAASLGDEALLDLRLAGVAGVRVDETRSYGSDGLALVAAQVRNALPLRTKVNRAALTLLARLDGRVPLRKLPGAEQSLPAIRELIALGLLRPSEA
jgi:methylase of polypeptide subunit release factors